MMILRVSKKSFLFFSLWFVAEYTQPDQSMKIDDRKETHRKGGLEGQNNEHEARQRAWSTRRAWRVERELLLSRTRRSTSRFASRLHRALLC